MSWELPLLTTLILSVLGFWTLRSSASRLSSLAALVVALLALPFLVDRTRLLQSFHFPTAADLYGLRPDVLIAHHFRMVLTLGAVVWYDHITRISKLKLTYLGSCTGHGRPSGSPCLSSSAYWASTFPKPPMSPLPEFAPMLPRLVGRLRRPIDLSRSI